MKKMRLKNKKKYKLKKRLLFFLIIVFLSCFITIKLLANISLQKQNEEFLTFLLENENIYLNEKKSTYSYFHKLMMKIINIDIKNPLTILNQNYKGLTSSDAKVEEVSLKSKTVVKKNTVENPLIYIYNTHQTENYQASSFLEYSVNPNVLMASYILEEQLKKKNYSVLVEEENVSEIRNTLGLNYAGSYKVTKSLMEKAKTTYPSLTYFIDLHRDSVSHDKSTLVKDGLDYARILFIVGLEYDTYQENLDFTNKINELLEAKMPGISRGIYKKEGAGVDGVYNQDFSNKTILIELGGEENTIDEVYRTVIILSEVLSEVITS